MKTIRNKVHDPNKSYDMTIKVINCKKVKFTYESYNANERFTVEIFDGYKWEHTFNMEDLGVVPYKSSYILSNEDRLKRADILIDMAETLMKELL